MNKANLSPNAIQVLRHRYLLRNDNGEITETPNQLFRRVAAVVAAAEKRFRKTKSSASKMEERFYTAMNRTEFLPNSPTLMNAGTSMGQLSACFVLPVDDSINSIFTALTNMARIHQTGGGTGFNFSSLRPRNDLIKTTKGFASGPVSFMRIFDTATGVIVQGGRRRGANMGILRCDHPDIMDFIEAKTDQSSFANFNLSVAITDKFMAALNKNRKFSLVNPRTQKTARSLPAREIFDCIARSAGQTGDPGLVFIDRINRCNPTPSLGPIEATNPCGELPLLPYESCNLGSINLVRTIKNNSIDWNKLKELVWLGVRFLDNVIEVNNYILPETEKITKGNRKIGLGIMGFADMLLLLGIPYNSPAAVRQAKTIMRFISREAGYASGALARDRGVFPNFKYSIYDKKQPRRNATCTTIAPTGTISIIAGCSSGIEPIFGISYTRRIIDGPRLSYQNPYFVTAARKNKFYSRALMQAIARKGTAKNIKQVPLAIRALFATALDISPQQQLLIQTAFQKYVDNSVSKTINLRPGAGITHIKKIYREAYKLRCKGITVYRQGTRKGQILLSGTRRPRNQSKYSGPCSTRECYL